MILASIIASSPEDFLLPGPYGSLRSSLLAFVGLKGKIDGAFWEVAFSVVQLCWRQELKHCLDTPTKLAALNRLFKEDQTAISTAVRLCRILNSKPVNVDQVIYQNVETPDVDRLGDGLDPVSQWWTLRSGRECRYCARSRCASRESQAGTFRMCAGCKIAVYCGRGKKSCM